MQVSINTFLKGILIPLFSIVVYLKYAAIKPPMGIKIIEAIKFVEISSKVVFMFVYAVK